MASNRLELVIEVATGAANVAIKGFNDSLSAMERSVIQAANNMAEGFQKFELQFAKSLQSFGKNVADFIRDPLNAAGNAIESFAKTMGPLGIGTAGLAGAFGALMTAGSAMAHSVGEAATAIYNTSIRMGVTVNDAKQLGIAAKMAGGDIGEFETAMRVLSKGMAENSEKGKEARETLRAWGISAKSDTMTVLEQVSTHLSGMKNHWEQANAAQIVFGRSGLTLLPILLDLAKNLQKVRTEGFGTTDEANSWGREMQAQVTLVDQRLAEIKKQYFAKPLASIWSITVEFIGAVSPKLIAIVDALGKVGATATALGTAGFGGWQNLKDVMGGIWSPTEAPAVQEAKAGHAALGVDSGGSGLGSPAASFKPIALGGSKSFFVNPGDLAGPMYDTSLGSTAVALETNRGFYHGASSPSLFGLQDFDRLPMTASAGVAKALAPSAANERYGETQIRMNALRSGQGELDTAKQLYQLRLLYADTDQKIADAEMALSQAQLSNEEKLAKAQQERYQKSFDTLKHGFEEVFDALISKSQHLGDVLLNIMKSAIITPVRNWASNAFASAFSPMLGNAGNGYAGAAAAPTGAMGLLGGGITGSPYDWSNRDDGMGGGIPNQYIDSPAGSMAGMGIPGSPEMAMAGMGGLPTGAMGALGSLGALFGHGAGSFAARAGMSGTAGLGMLGIGAGALGVYGGSKLATMSSPWAKGAGIGIAGFGGAVAGGGLMAMFPALASFGMAVPIAGAAIAAGIALYMAFGYKSPEQKMIDDVKSAYNVTIDTPEAKSLVQRAGGMDFRVFLQRPDIRDEIMLYKSMTRQAGNTALGVDAVPHGVNLQESGGSLYQAATYYNGGSFGYQSSLPSTGSFTTLSPVINASFSLNGQATTAALGGAVVSTTSQSQGRAALNANINSPLAVLI